jgi:MFS family permease
MQSVRGMSPFATGLTLVPLAIAQLVAAPTTPALVRRYGTKAVCGVGMGLVAVALGGLCFMEVDTPLWLIILDTAVLGLGMGTTMAPATTSVMQAVPRDKAGAGSAVSQASRQVGATFGVAIIGSVLSASYRASMAPTLDQIPVLSAHQRDLIGSSIEATLGFVEKVAPQVPMARALIAPAQQAYVEAARIATEVSVAAAVIGLIVVLLWMPGQNFAAQLKPAE